MKDRTFSRLFLLLPAVVILYLAWKIFQPFLIPVSLAVVLSTLFYPLYRKIHRSLKGRKNLASTLTCLLIILAGIIPCLLLLVLLAQEVTQTYEMVQGKIESGEYQRIFNQELNPYFQTALDQVNKYVNLKDLSLLSGMSSLLRQASVFLIQHSTAIVGGFMGVLVDLSLMIFTMFFLFRDGSVILKNVDSLIPLSRKQEILIARKFREVTNATIFGSFITAVAQGFAGGVVFYFLGISNLVFWAVAFALFSLVPVVGTSLIWVPWTAYFLLSGSYIKGIALLIAAIIFIGTIDNILRPLLIEGRVKMHTLLVFFSIMGGIAYAGMAGMIFGPILISLFLTLLELYKVEFKEDLQKFK